MPHQYSDRLLDRFWSRVDKSGECWLWTGPTAGQGHYGILHADGHNGRNLYAHRVSWEIHFGPIPDGMVICHHCDTPLCIRPIHLFMGTHADNVADKVRKGRHLVGEKSPNAILTNWIVMEIHRLWREGGITQTAMAIRFGVNRITISDVLRGRCWAHLLPADFVKSDGRARNGRRKRSASHRK